MSLPSASGGASFSRQTRGLLSARGFEDDSHSSSGGSSSGELGGNDRRSDSRDKASLISAQGHRGAYSAHVSSGSESVASPSAPSASSINEVSSFSTARSSVSSGEEENASAGSKAKERESKGRLAPGKINSNMSADSSSAIHSAAGRPDESDARSQANPSTPSSPRFRIASTITSPLNGTQADVQGSMSASSSAVTATRRSAGAWRASRMQQGSTAASQFTPASGSNSPRRPLNSESNAGLAAGELNTRFSSNDGHDDWEDWPVDKNAVVTPPGAMTTLPSIHAADEGNHGEAPWLPPQPAKKTADYDWASFVYAYGRGKWDPARLPQPPGQSSLFPGTESRIGARFGDVVRPISPERTEDASIVTVRRPSVEYVPGMPSVIHRQLSEPDRRSSIASLQEVSRSFEENMKNVELRERAKTAHFGAEEVDVASLSARIHAAKQLSPEPGSIFVNPLDLLRLASSNSAPQVGQAAALGEFAQRLMDDSDPNSMPKKATKAANTDTQVITRASLPRMPSDPTHKKPPEPSPQSNAQATDGQSSRSASAVAATRPALAAQMSQMTISGVHTSRGYDSAAENKNLSGVNSPESASRPGPTPMQSVEDVDGEDGEDSSSKLPESAEGSSYVALDKEKEGELSRILQMKDGAAEQGSSDLQKKVGEALKSESSGVHRDLDIDAFLSRSNDEAQARAEPACTRLLPLSYDSNIVAGGEDPEHRFSQPTLQEMPALLAKIGHSYSSPSVSSYIGIGRSIESFYKDFGYLPGIDPPDEVERRQALRRYGPPKLRGDSNFERIAHLVKLVFNTKLVLISLVGEKTQFFQTEVGASSLGYKSDWLQQVAGSRDCSMCAHAILQPNDEPLVVLDAQRDWRFAGNPLVVGDPFIRFYAGAPLRTSDGFNLGSLCIIDNKPWTEFGPRQRHTLREFARVAMREMELMRDTIHLRTQDRMQHSIELFTRKCIEMESSETDDDKEHDQGLHQVYALAAKSMCDALQATGAVLFDLSHFELVVSPHHFDGAAEDADPNRSFGQTASYQYPESVSFANQTSDTGQSFDTPVLQSVPSNKAAEEQLVPPMAVLGAWETLSAPATREQNVPVHHYVKIADFLRKHRTGSFFPFTPLPFRHLLPPGMSNILLVPIFGLNRQPFALLCAYSRHSEDGGTLEDIKDSGLQYMRAMGTIILSAILKKDIMLADKAKSHFISNISHELRTPLHGILAAAELLAETKINATQGSYLETVEACGKSLLELVNHVLDFTKLSGNVHSKQSALKPSQQCDLVKLVQEVCESSWIGQMAKNLDSQQHAGIGSAYAKGSEASSVYSNNTESDSGKSGLADISNPVETVIDVSMRQKGWLVNCDAGGIRRVLMNLIGNSLKFTQKGFVHVSLREVQSTETHVLIELGVTDTGKGISRAFLEEQLFHPFTQENHLGPGTGLGLSIVNSIVQSPAINGKIDVWSTVGQGTEIRVTCELELSNPAEAEGTIYRPVLNVEQQRSITFLGFDDSMRGQNDLKDVMRSYYEDWWRFRFCDDMRDGDIILINDNYTLIRKIMKARKAPLPPIILLASARGGTHVSKICDEYQEAGGVVRQLFKPAGPAKLEAVTDFCLQCFERGFAGLPMVDDGSAHSTPLPSPALTSRNQSGGDYFTKDEDQDDADAETPRGPIATKTTTTTTTTTTDVTTEPAAGSPRPGPRYRERPGLTDDLRRNSHHISPGPPSASDAVLLRRHSSEGRKKGVDGAAVLSDQQARDEEIEHAAHTSIGAGSSKGMLQPKSSSRPLMPTRSITYHEPRLQRHVLMSPLRSPHYRRGEGTEQQMDYFGPAAATSVSSLGNAAYTGYSSASFDTSGPSSPGSVISLEGGEGAVLRSAINNAGLVRNPSGQPSQHKKRLQILSVEDNSINRRVLAAFFGKMEVDLVEATNGEEGVRAFESHPPFHFDVIFMDLSMPVLDGIGAMMQIRKIEADRFRAEQSNTMSWIRGIQQQQRGTGTGAPSGKSTGRAGQASTSPNTFSTLLSTPGGTRPSAQARAKIFALTGRSSDEDKRRAFSTGADGFIVKPLSYKVLSTLINTISAYR